MKDLGGEVVGKAVAAMAQIEASSGKISDIIGVIDEIARQTNLLALNEGSSQTVWFRGASRSSH